MVAVETGLAFLTFKIRRKFLRFLLIIFSLYLPQILAENVKPFRGVKATFLAYALAGALIAVYKTYQEETGKSKKHKIKKPTIQDGIIRPAYLPPHFEETDSKFSNKKGNMKAEIIYGRNDSEHLIWIVQSDRTPFAASPRKNMEKTEKVIEHVPVYIEHEIQDAKSLNNSDPPFVEANWSHNGINFNLRSDGITLDDSDKIISSMIRSKNDKLPGT
jgi:hypothetical protein